MAQTQFTETPKEQLKPVAGKKLPEGLKNPERGTMGHLCLDGKGNYQPKWMQLLLRRPSGLSVEFEFFKLNDEAYYIPYNKWVDVPPAVVKLLQDAKSDVLESNVNELTGEYVGDLTRPGEMMKVIDTIPAFSYTLLPSA